MSRILLVLLGICALAGNAAALDRRVEMVNATNLTIMELYGSNRDAGTWEEDVLGSSVLAPQSSVVVNWNDGSGYCMFDVRAVFENGVSESGYFNVCEEVVIIFDGYGGAQ
jgi:hypothetical protein